MIKVDVPTFTHTMISGQTVKCRPFLVKEEKLFLMAMESDEEKDLYNTTLQIISNCLLDDTIEVDKLPFFEVDYLMLTLRAQSVGASIPMNYTCHNKVPETDETKQDPEAECGHKFQSPITKDNIVIHKEDMKDNTLSFNNGTVHCELKYPTYTDMKIAEAILDDLDQQISLVGASINKIWDNNEVQDRTTMTDQEVGEFLGEMTKADFNKLQEFINGAPYILIEAEVECPKCKFKDKTTYEGFESFFV